MVLPAPFLAVLAVLVAAPARNVNPSLLVLPDVVCASKPGERQTCAADTKHGVRLLHTYEDSKCELGRTWGWDEHNIWVSDGCRAAFDVGQETPKVGGFTPGSGFRIAEGERGTLNLKLWAYIRYLNQNGLDDAYVDAFGLTRRIVPREDLQFQKANIQFVGWALTPKLRYLAYVWTSNTSQGLGAQVVVAGRLDYTFNRHVTLGGGIGGLPGTRSTEGSFPNFLPLDNRSIADAFFQPSYTSGIWVNGEISDQLEYSAMLGNNLSQLGIDAGQLRGGMDTFAARLAWMPTTGEFGPQSGFGDFENHERVATRFGTHFTRSDENTQSQPDAEAPENSQIRLSNGGIVFTPGLFGSGVAVSDVHYRMSAVDAGVKYRGLSLESEYYFRWLSDFKGPGTSVISDQFDHGFQLLASGMAIPHLLQGYAIGSQVFGEFGDPYEFRLGVNWFPMKHRAMRWNGEWMYLRRSPVGALSLPYVVGANGSLFNINLEINF